MQFKYTGWVQKTIEELRSILGIERNKLRQYGHLKDKSIKHAVDEINNNHELDLRFEEIKEGRKVVAIKFLFKKLVHDNTPKQLVLFPKTMLC